MFDTLNKLCPEYKYSDEHPPQGHSFLVQDSNEQSALFLWLEFVKTALSSSEPTSILLFQHSYSSLALLLRKQGISLDSGIRTSRVTVYEVNESSTDMVTCEIPLTEQRPQGYLDRANKVKSIRLTPQGWQQVLSDLTTR